MAKRPEHEASEDRDLQVGEPAQVAAGVRGVAAGLRVGLTQMGVARAARTLARVNQPEGFDCPGCAWPEPPPRQRSHAEFCENGVKAVAAEATRRRIDADFFASHSIAELAARSEHWLGQQGRLTEPMVRRAGATHYTPISWDDAFSLVATEMRACQSPDQAVFYTSGRSSNEAAYLWQLLARAWGTNNLPDCSNMCHESSGVALSETIGVGKGTATLDDIHAAALIVIVGQNPGTNHPRMLTALERAKRAGAKILAINPLPEAGLLKFRNPQRAAGVAGRATPLADRFLQIRVGGDAALFQAIGRLLVEWGALDHDFIGQSTEGFEAYAARRVDRSRACAETGLTWAEIEASAKMFAESPATVVCWAMGLTQGPHAVATIQEIVNVQLLRGMIGIPGAGLCPVRGHSNVQGDRTMGIWHELPPWAGRMAERHGFELPGTAGLDTVDTIRAMRDGKVSVFASLGGNFAAATPDSQITERALQECSLTVQVSTKLNRSHAVPGRTALILPCLGRTERDLQASGEQLVTVEDSMCCVHASRGRLAPASPQLRSEVAIVSGIGQALGLTQVPWQRYIEDYRTIRTEIAAVVPGFDDFESRVSNPAGFVLPLPPRDTRTFPTASGRASFTVHEVAAVTVPPGRLLLQTMRSHDQYNTTIYGLDDRYRGIRGGRRVVFVHPEDLAALSLADGAIVDLVSEWTDGVSRRAERFRVVAYPTARGCAAAYFPEANVLVPLDSTAAKSNTPTSKSIVIRLELRERAEE